MTHTTTQRTVRAEQRRDVRRGSAVNVWLMGAVGGLSGFQLFVLPLWLIPANPAWGWALLSVPLMTTPVWSLVHEAIHRTPLASRARRHRCGRGASVGYRSP